MAKCAELYPLKSLFHRVWQRFGVYHVITLVLLVYQIALTGYIGKQSKAVTQLYLEGAKSNVMNMVFAMRMLILIPQFIGGLVGIFALIDVAGAFRIFDYFTARTLMNARTTIVGTTDIVVLFYCHDIYHAFKASQRLQPHSPFLVGE